MAASKQLNFFFSDLDQRLLGNRLDETGSVLAVQLPLGEPRLVGQPVRTFSKWQPGQHQVLLFRPADQHKIEAREVPSRGYWVDMFANPVVEFSRCVQTNDEIIRGRLYVIAEYFGKRGERVRKSEQFLDWANNIFRIARGLCKIRRNGICVGSEAASLEALGYRLISP